MCAHIRGHIVILIMQKLGVHHIDAKNQPFCEISKLLINNTLTIILLDLQIPNWYINLTH